MTIPAAPGEDPQVPPSGGGSHVGVPARLQRYFELLPELLPNWDDPLVQWQLERWSGWRRAGVMAGLVGILLLLEWTRLTMMLSLPFFAALPMLLVVVSILGEVDDIQNTRSAVWGIRQYRLLQPLFRYPPRLSEALHSWGRPGAIEAMTPVPIDPSRAAAIVALEPHIFGALPPLSVLRVPILLIVLFVSIFMLAATKSPLFATLAIAAAVGGFVIAVSPLHTYFRILASIRMYRRLTRTALSMKDVEIGFPGFSGAVFITLAAVYPIAFGAAAAFRSWEAALAVVAIMGLLRGCCALARTDVEARAAQGFRVRTEEFIRFLDTGSPDPPSPKINLTADQVREMMRNGAG